VGFFLVLFPIRPDLWFTYYIYTPEQVGIRQYQRDGHDDI